MMLKSSPDLKLLNLPNYDVRENRRARNVHLKILPTGNLQVVVPQGFNYDRIPEIVSKKRHWIEKVQQRLQEQRESLGFDITDPLPKMIVLRAIDQQWEVTYHSSSQPQVTVREAERLKLSVEGNINQIELCRAALRQWLAHQAKLHLIPWIESISEEIGLQFAKISIRGQRTRWGSCSRHRAISLNYKLMLLPPQMVRYVLVHELCHTVHLNHSQKFWDLVQEKEPDYKQLDRELYHSCCYVPLWVESHH